MDTIKSLKPNIVSVLHIIKLNATDSSNTYLKNLVQETSVEDGTIVLVEDQQKGRGQMGNGWLSRRGQSLTFSVFKRFQTVKADEQFLISMAVALAIIEALKNIGIPNVTIKWPNDILSGNKKLAGILIENVLERTNIRHAIIGVGINVNETDFSFLPQASSLKLEGGRTLELSEVFEIVSSKILYFLQEIPNLQFIQLKNLYERNMFRIDMISVFEKKDGTRFNGKIMGISELGELMVYCEGSGIGKFQLKELKLLY